MINEKVKVEREFEELVAKGLIQGVTKPLPTKDTPTKDNSTKDKRNICPHQKIIESYHQNCPSLPAVQVHGKTQRANLKTRWKEDPKRQNLEWWNWYFKNVQLSKYLTGKVNSWSATFGWLIGPKNMAKVYLDSYQRSLSVFFGINIMKMKLYIWRCVFS